MGLAGLIPSISFLPGIEHLTNSAVRSVRIEENPSHQPVFELVSHKAGIGLRDCINQHEDNEEIDERLPNSVAIFDSSTQEETGYTALGQLLHPLKEETYRMLCANGDSVKSESFGLEAQEIINFSLTCPCNPLRKTCGSNEMMDVWQGPPRAQRIYETKPLPTLPYPEVVFAREIWRLTPKP